MSLYAVSVTLIRHRWWGLWDDEESAEFRVFAHDIGEAMATVALQIELTRRIAEIDNSLEVTINTAWLAG